MPDPAAFDAAYFQGREPNAYHRIFGLKGFVTRWLRRRIPPDATLLDVGCGTGLYLSELRWLEKRYGCDVSEFALTAARKTAPDARFDVIASTGELPFGDVAFDVITAFDVVEHVDDDRAFVKRIGERLKAGGFFVFSTPNPRSLGRRIKKQHWFAYRDPTHVNVHEPRHFLALIDGLGFDALCVRYDGFWDTPYFSANLVAIERILIQLPSVLAFNYFPFRDARCGENLVVIARKRGP